MTPPRLADQRLCRTCAGIATNFDCTTCGQESELHRGGSCARCTLRGDLTDLLRPTDAGAPAALARLVDLLAGVDRPASVHTWKRNPAVRTCWAASGTGPCPLTMPASTWPHRGVPASTCVSSLPTKVCFRLETLTSRAFRTG